MDREFSEFANALLALRTGKPAETSVYPSISFSADDNDSTGFEEDDMFRSKMSNNIVPFPSLSWASRDFAATYGLVDHATPTKGKKRVHSVSLSATSSESNDSNDVDSVRVKKTAVAGTTGSNTDKKTTLARGRYRCSLCGAFKTNHVCALVADKLMCSVSTQSLQANDLVSSMLLSNQKELRVQCRGSAGIAAIAVAAPSSCYVAPTATAAGSTVSDGPPRTFQERIVTVTRNRKTIQGPEPVAPVVAVGQLFVNTSMATQEASSDGSSVLTLRQPLLDTSGSMALGATAHGGSGSAGATPVTPTSTYAFPTHLPPYAAHAQPVGAMLPGGYLYGNAMHSSLLGVPLQATTLAPTAVPSFPQVHRPRQSQASVKTAPNLIYPSALDLLGQAI